MPSAYIPKSRVTPDMASLPSNNTEGGCRKRFQGWERISAHVADANLFLLASAARRSASEEKTVAGFVTPVGLSPLLLELSRPPLPWNLPPLPLPRPLGPLMRAGSSKALDSSVLLRFRDRRSGSVGNASSNLPTAVCSIPKRFARSSALCASSSAFSVPAAPVCASPLAAAAAVPKRSARALRFASSASISDCGKCRAYESDLAEAVSASADEVAVASAWADAGASAGADSATAGASLSCCVAGSDCCSGGALVDSAGGALVAPGEKASQSLSFFACFQRAMGEGGTSGGRRPAPMAGKPHCSLLLPCRPR